MKWVGGGGVFSSLTAPFAAVLPPLMRDGAGGGGGRRSAEHVCTPPRQEVEQSAGKREKQRQGDVTSHSPPPFPLAIHNISSFTPLPLSSAPPLLSSLLMHSACLKSNSKLVVPSIRISRTGKLKKCLKRAKDEKQKAAAACLWLNRLAYAPGG